MFGQIPDFSNGFEFLRNLWGASSAMPGGMMPGMQAMTPPMDLEDVDKRIHDLKAVEGWLQLNASLLRTTIQGLEVQRATLVALQTFGKALSPDAMQTAMENVARAANAPSATPHHHAFTMPTRAPESAPDVASDDDPPGAWDEVEDEDEFADENTEALPDDAPVEAAAPEGHATMGDTTGNGEAAGEEAALPPNAALWWNLLQQQFNQIASGAAAASMAPFGSPGGVSAAEPARPAPGTTKGTTTRKTTASSGKPPGKSAAKPTQKAAGKTAAKKAAKPRPATAKKPVAKKAVTKKAAAKKSA